MALAKVQERRAYKASQGLSLGLVCHRCHPIPLTKQSLKWEGQTVTGQRAWSQQWGEASETIVKSTTAPTGSGWTETNLNEIKLLRSDQRGYGCCRH